MAERGRHPWRAEKCSCIFGIPAILVPAEKCSCIFGIPAILVPAEKCSCIFGIPAIHGREKKRELSLP